MNTCNKMLLSVESIALQYHRVFKLLFVSTFSTTAQIALKGIEPYLSDFPCSATELSAAIIKGGLYYESCQTAVVGFEPTFSESKSDVITPILYRFLRVANIIGFVLLTLNVLTLYHILLRLSIRFF